MSACFGIHLGDSSICLALDRDGKTEIVANDLGDRVTPAVLAFDGSEFEICASHKTGTRRKAFIKNNKRLFDDGVSEDDIEKFNARNDCKLVSYENTLTYELQNENNLISLTPDNVATKFFSKMFSIAAHAACAEGELRTVIAVPLHWTDESRTRITTAAELAGFSVLHAINEPAAAALAYDIGDDNVEEYVLIYRLGGTSCDVSIIRAAAGVYSVEANIRQSGIGGQYITSDLADYIAADFYKKWKLDPRENKRAMDKLFNNANECKHILSTLNSAHLFVESLCEGVDWSQNVSRARFENILSSKIDSFMAPIHELLSKNDFKSKITKIIMCGGCMKIPKLQSAVSEILPNAAVLNKLAPDEVIAYGCSKQASLLLEYQDLTLRESNVSVDCIKNPIFAKYLDENITLFPVGAPIYSEIKVPLKRSADAADIDLHVYTGGDKEDLIRTYSFACATENPRIHAILNNKELTVNVI